MRARTAVYLLPLVMLCSVVPTVHASTSRILALGGAADFLEDAANVDRWYGTLPVYGNTLALELGQLVADSGSDQERLGQGLGLFMDLGEQGRLGTAGLRLVGQDGLQPRGGSTGLFWGKSGRRHDLGFMIRMRDDEEAYGASDLGYDFLRSEHDLTLGAGLRLELNPRTYGDIAVDLTGTDRTLVENNWILMDQQEQYDSWSARLRLFRSLTPDLVLTTHWAHTHEDHGWLGGETPLPALLAENSTRFGAGVTIFPDPDSMVLLGFSYVDLQGRLEPGYGVWAADAQRWQYRSFDLVLALESRLMSWLTLRGGVRSSLSEKENYPPLHLGESHYWAQTGIWGDVDRNLTIDLGLALHIGDFDLDLVINQDPLFHLGDVLGGADGSSQSTISSISVGYFF